MDEAFDQHVRDVVEITQLLARYGVGLTKYDVPSVQAVFATDGIYRAFGEDYTVDDFPTLVAAAPKGLYHLGPPVIDVDGDTATGEQTLCFVDQTTHDMRIGWYSDTYVRTAQGWRIRTRGMTFLRRSGDRDSGKAHDPLRPAPSAQPDGRT